MGQIIKSLASTCHSVCKHSNGRNFDEILHSDSRPVKWDRVCFGKIWQLVPLFYPQIFTHLHYGLWGLQSGI